MSTTILRLVIAAIFAIGAWLSWSESQLSARVAGARQAIATFDYEATNALEPQRSLSDYLPGDGRRLSDDISIAKANVAYWLGRYEAVTGDTGGRADADVLLAAANAAFRAARRDASSGPAAVQQLDGVLQAYAAAMKASPDRTASASTSPAREAAYNFEFVARLRDEVARGPQGKAARAAAPAAGLMGGDLPAGPTIHGAPGAPPPDAKTEEFQTIMPMEYGDREAQPEATPGAKRQRKG
jgi:hypothetical protein